MKEKELRNFIRSIVLQQKKNILKQDVTEEQHQAELRSAINQYNALGKKIDQKYKGIQQALKELEQIKGLQKQRNSVGKQMQKYMIRFNIAKKKIDDWVLQLKSELKFKRPQLSYKQSRDFLMKKVNKAIQDKVLQMQQAEMKTKSQAKELKLFITQNQRLTQDKIGNKIKAVFNKVLGYFKGIFSKIKKIQDLSKELPKIVKENKFRDVLRKEIVSVMKQYYDKDDSDYDFDDLRYYSSDGWNTDELQHDFGIMEWLQKCEKLQYQMNSARRGSYALQGDSLYDLFEYLNDLKKGLKEILDKMNL